MSANESKALIPLGNQGARSAARVYDGNQTHWQQYSVGGPIVVNRSSKGKGESGDSPQRRKVSKAETFAAVQAEFLSILKHRETGVVDLIYDRLEIPADARPRIGRAIADLARRGRIEKVEFRPSGRGVAHGRNVFVWRLIR